MHFIVKRIEYTDEITKLKSFIISQPDISTVNILEDLNNVNTN